MRSRICSELRVGHEEADRYKKLERPAPSGNVDAAGGYEPGKKYPMVVYFYELMSDTHHNFSSPCSTTGHTCPVCQQRLPGVQPDVRYEIGKPGPPRSIASPGGEEVIELGTRSARIGCRGTAGAATNPPSSSPRRTCSPRSSPGAPPTDLTSFYGTLYKSTAPSSKGSRKSGRCGWAEASRRGPQTSVREPVAGAQRAEDHDTFMILHGTADGSVDWSQGLEFYPPRGARQEGDPAFVSG